MVANGFKRAMFAALVLAAASAAPAQTPEKQSKAAGPTSDMWKFEGLTFPARDGWCTKLTDQGTPSEPSPAIEARACGTDFPYMSMTIGQRGAGNGPADIPKLLAYGVTYTNGADAKKLMLGMANSAHTSCVQLTYLTRNDAVPGVPGFAVEASYDCSENPGKPMWIKNFTTYASSKSGDVWVISFDYPRTSVTSGDAAMLQSAIYTVSNH